MEKQKHILFISSWYPNRNNPSHGIFNKFFAEAAALHNKVSVLHICSDEHMASDLEFSESTENNIYTLIVYYKKIKSALPFVDLLFKRKKVLKAFELGYSKLTSQVGTPDLIQLNVIMLMGVGAYHLSKKHRIPFVINEGWTGYFPEDGSYKGLVKKYFTKKIISNAQVLMPVSERLMQAMQTCGLHGNYVIVPNVVDVELFKPQEKTQSNSVVKFFHVSALDDEQKNVSGIIRAFAQALKTNANMELKIIGESEEKKKFQGLVERLAVADKIKFIGRLMGHDLVNEINAGDALIMFSNYETFSLAVAEAWACGKPVIASKAGGLTSEVTAELGVMIEKKNEGQLTRAILNFQKEKYNSAIIRQFVVDNFAKEKIGKQLTEIYQSVLA